MKDVKRHALSLMLLCALCACGGGDRGPEQDDQDASDAPQKSGSGGKKSGSMTGNSAGSGGDAARSNDGAAGSDEPGTGSDGKAGSMNKPGTSSAPNSVDDPSPPSAASDLHACPTIEGMTPDVSLAGELGGDQHWHGIVRVSSDVSVDGGKVSIEPGTLFIMDIDSSITFGLAGQAAATVLDARGTAERPIRFCGGESTPGYWKGITLYDGVNGDSQIEHWLIDGAGRQQGAGLTLDSDAQFKHVQVRHSAWDGVAATRFGTQCEGLAVEAAANYAVSLDGVAACTRFPANSRFFDNAHNAALVAFGSVFRPLDQLTFHNIGIPYQQEGDLVLGSGGKVTFEAGVEYRFGALASFDVAKFGPMELQVQGSDSQPVVFRGVESQKGYWRGLRVSYVASRESKIAHATFTDGGAGDAHPLMVDGPITLENVVVRDNAIGMRVGGPLNPASKEVSIMGNAGVALSVTAEAMIGLPKSMHFEGNEKMVVAVDARRRGPRVVGIIPNVGLPYRVESLTFSDNADRIEIEAGTEFLFAPQGKLEIGTDMSSGELIAVGTADHPITFRGETDAAGAWQGLMLNSSVSPNSKFDHVALVGAGLRLMRPVTVENSSFTNSADYGITKSMADSTDYAASNSFHNNGAGSVGTF